MRSRVVSSSLFFFVLFCASFAWANPKLDPYLHDLSDASEFKALSISVAPPGSDEPGLLDIFIKAHDVDTVKQEIRALGGSVRVSSGEIVTALVPQSALEELTRSDSVLFIGPLMCGLILGIVSYEQDAVNTVIGTIIMTVVATLAVALTLFYPFLLGVVSDPSGLLYFIYIPQNMMITVILVLPLSLLGSISGRLFAENTFQSSIIKKEREFLKSETEEWYKMLEEKLDEKKAALEKLERERDLDLLNIEETPPPTP